MNWQNWLKGLAAAAIGGAATSVTLLIVDPAHFTEVGKLATICGVNALLNAAMYLKQSPIPDGK